VDAATVDDQLCTDNFPTVAIHNANVVSPECDWARVGKCLVCRMAGPTLVPCQMSGCVCHLHHMCQTEWESANIMREAHGSKKLCAYHHPALPNLPAKAMAMVTAKATAPLPPLCYINDCETEWLLDTNKSVQQVYWQNITPTPDSNYALPSTTVCGDFVFDLAILITMATGTLADIQIQLERINQFCKKGWLKKRSLNLTKEMFKKEILHCHDILILSMFDNGTSDTDSLNTESTGRSKKPSTMGNIVQLKKSMDEIGGKCPLKFRSKKEWLEQEIGNVLDYIENFMDETRKKQEQAGDFLRKNHKILMQLTHGEIMPV
jgi:hypothetical protein